MVGSSIPTLDAQKSLFLGTAYALGWRSHIVATEERLPLCYAGRSANVKERVPAPKLVDQAVTLLGKAGSSMMVLLADP